MPWRTEIMDAAVSIDGVGNVAAIDGTSSLSMVSSTASEGSEDAYEMFMFYLQYGRIRSLPERAGA